MFLALAALYESWTLPLAVILVVPMCLLCSLVGVAMRGMDVEHLRADRLRGAGGPGLQERDPDRRVRQGPGTRRAWSGSRPRTEACRLRLRPILMTSFAFILGVVPLVVAMGRGPKCAGRWGPPCSAACWA